MGERAQGPPFIPLSAGGSAAARPPARAFRAAGMRGRRPPRGCPRFLAGADRACAVPGVERPAIVRGTVGSVVQLVYYREHFDVVPAQSASQLEPERRDGKIIGRGTADMKGGLVSMLYGAAAGELGLLDDRKIVFHFVCDQETGSTAGSGHLRGAELIDPDAVAMLTAKPTGGVIWHACRGAITLRPDPRLRGARRVRPRGRQRLRARSASPSRSRGSPTSCSASARAIRSSATRPRARCWCSADKPAPEPASTSCPAPAGTRHWTGRSARATARG